MSFLAEIDLLRSLGIEGLKVYDPSALTPVVEEGDRFLDEEQTLNLRAAATETDVNKMRRQRRALFDFGKS